MFCFPQWIEYEAGTHNEGDIEEKGKFYEKSKVHGDNDNPRDG